MSAIAGQVTAGGNHILSGEPDLPDPVRSVITGYFAESGRNILAAALVTIRRGTKRCMNTWKRPPL